jgi:hypothetical protein
VSNGVFLGNTKDLEENMRFVDRLALLAAVVTIPAAMLSFAKADGMQAGMWKLTKTDESGGVTAPPRQSLKCYTAEDVGDLPKIFTPQAATINSICAPIERTFDGRKLNFHLVCKGQLDMELTGAFDFDTPHHYTGTVDSKATMAGQTIAQRQKLEAEWVSECP